MVADTYDDPASADRAFYGTDQQEPFWRSLLGRTSHGRHGETDADALRPVLRGIRRLLGFSYAGRFAILYFRGNTLWDRISESDGTKNFRVLYNETNEGLEWQNETPSNDEFPVKGCYYCTFRREEKAMPLMDYRFREFFERRGNDELTAEEETTLNERFNVRGHAVGGYADFTQDDPRAAKECLL